MISLIFVILLSVLVVSLISFVGAFSLSIKTKKLRSILLYLVSFSAGALLGDSFIHLLPEVVKTNGFGLNTSLYILLGIILFFVLEKFVYWEHCHGGFSEEYHIHSFAYMNLVGDSLHNFLDGIIIASSYFVSMQVGVATTIAVILHEIPQEIGDFGILLHGGFTKGKALLFNFFFALTSFVGAVVALFLSNNISNIESIFIPLTVGSFIYIAGSDLIPELHKETYLFRSLIQLFAFVLGIVVMVGLLFLG